MKSKVLIFSGPTLSGQTDFKNSLHSKFVFHPPVRCGDILEAHREGYDKILVVDGFFEFVASVWHKEIADVIQKGGTIIGCSSMGALRAVELQGYGMLGFGKIFNDFNTGKIRDDDEVTVAHLSAEQDFLPITDAMVNIRFTVENAINQDMLDSRDAFKILNLLKSTFYKKRNLKFMVHGLAKEKPRLVKFQKYLDEHGMVDQKFNDASDVIKNIDSCLKPKLDKINIVSDKISNSYNLQSLRHNLNITAPSLERNALSYDSIFLKMARLLVGEQYRLHIKLAGAMAEYYEFIKNKPASKCLSLSWLDEAWIDGNEHVNKLLACALEACPEYRNTTEYPLTVRHLCYSLELPIQYLDFELSESHGEKLITNSTKTFSRLLYLIGLFLDARLAIDPLATRVVATPKAIQANMARQILWYDTEDKQKKFMSDFGLSDLLHAASEAEKNNLLLAPPPKGISFKFLEQEINWFKLAAQVSGIWKELLSLSKKDARESFSKELSDDLKKMFPPMRLKALIASGLPPDLLSKEAILEYIGELE